MKSNTIEFRHSEDTLDPRDTSIVTYSSKSKQFITEASTLRANGIAPFSFTYVIGGSKYVLFLWSEKYKLHIPYRFARKVYDAANEVVADVFTPYFGIITGRNASLAHQASLGIELHILND